MQCISLDIRKYGYILDMCDRGRQRRRENKRKVGRNGMKLPEVP